MMRRYLDPDLEHKNKPRYGSLRGEEQESCTEKQVLKRRLSLPDSGTYYLHLFEPFLSRKIGNSV